MLHEVRYSDDGRRGIKISFSFCSSSLVFRAVICQRQQEVNFGQSGASSSSLGSVWVQGLLRSGVLSTRHSVSAWMLSSVRLCVHIDAALRPTPCPHGCCPLPIRPLALHHCSILCCCVRLATWEGPGGLPAPESSHPAGTCHTLGPSVTLSPLTTDPATPLWVLLPLASFAQGSHTFLWGLAQPLAS